jgi:short-subunit dehydrogenase
MHDNTSNFWPPWPFSLLVAQRQQRQVDKNSQQESQTTEKRRIGAAAVSTAFGIWPLVRDTAKLTWEQMSSVSRNLWIHLPPGLPPLLLYAGIPRTVVQKGTTESALSTGSKSAVQSAVQEVERIIPLFSNPLIRNIALSGFALAVMSWAHAELHHQRSLTPLGIEIDKKNYHTLPPFLPEMPQEYDKDTTGAATGLASLLPDNLQTTVLQWTQSRKQRTIEQQRTRRLSVEEELLALQRPQQNGRRLGRRNMFRKESTSSSSSERLALVTGASRGIGRAIAVELARHKVNLILVARDLERLHALGADLEKYYGIQCYVVTADLGLPNGAEKLYQATKNANLNVDILVNNAGYSMQGPSSVDMNVVETNNLIQCNAVSVSTLMHLFGNDMKRRRRGRILNMSSICGAVAGVPTVAVYSATKAFCNSLTNSMALELEAFGVGVTSCVPGAVKGTDFKARSATDEALCWKWPGYAKDPERIAQVSIQAMLQGDIECIPGWENRFFLRILKPVIPVRIVSVYSTLMNDVRQISMCVYRCLYNSNASTTLLQASSGTHCDYLF